MKMWHISRTERKNCKDTIKVQSVEILHWSEQTAVVSCNNGKIILVDYFNLWKANSDREFIKNHYSDSVIDWSDIDKQSEFTVTEYIRQSKPWGL